MQPKGSLAETDLRSLLESAQAERATGTLTVHEGDRACTLYFLFGHLFHAQSDGISGDDAVRQALGWPEGTYDFDAKAKLPPDETVKSSIPELIDTAGTQSAQPSYSPGQENGEQPAQPEPVGWHAVQPESDPTPSYSTQEATPAPEINNENSDPFGWPAVEPPQPRRSLRPQAQSRKSGEPVPVPAGTVMYDHLKTSFVDFPRLITTLEKEHYTGYVRLMTDDSSGLIFFREGQALECVYDSGGETQMGRQALTAFNQQVSQGQGVLDVVNLTPELINGVYELTVAQPMYTELYASWVDMPALLNFLEDRKLTGSVTVSAQQATGVILLTNGELTGAYTTESRDVARDVNAILALCSDAEAMIEVKSATEPGSPGRLDVDEIVGRGRGAAQPTAPQPVATPPQQQMQAPAMQAPAAPPPPLDQTAPHRYNSQSSSNDVQAAPVQAPVAQLAPEQRFEPETPSPAPAPAATFRTSGGTPDWEQVISDLQTMADESLGNRSRKVKDVLGAADRSQEGVLEAINQVPTISILFIDHSRLESLADEMRARVQSY